MFPCEVPSPGFTGFFDEVHSDGFMCRREASGKDGLQIPERRGRAQWAEPAALLTIVP
jgi:hypothetical protein